MDELIHLLTDWAHWAFEIISGSVVSLVILLIPERFNPAKRLVSRHDREKHGEPLCDAPGCGRPASDPVHGVIHIVD